MVTIQVEQKKQPKQYAKFVTVYGDNQTNLCSNLSMTKFCAGLRATKKCDPTTKSNKELTERMEDFDWSLARLKHISLHESRTKQGGELGFHIN